MEMTLSLEEKIKNLIGKKLASCNCNPCNCSNQKKEVYFKELKEILKKFNKEKLTSIY
jgi:hypothetical protein